MRSTLHLQPTKLTNEIAEHEEDISVWTGDVRTATTTKILDANIKDLDNMAVEPTASRKEENSDSKTLFASDVAAKEV